MTAATKFRGVDIEIDGSMFVLPAMSLGIVEDFQDQIDDMLAGKVARPVSLMIDVLHKCLQRNYPDMTREQVRGGIDLESVQDVFVKLLKRSGWDAGSATEPPAGNQAGQTGLGIGGASTPTSQPASETAPTTTGNT